MITATTNHISAKKIHEKPSTPTSPPTKLAVVVCLGFLLAWESCCFLSACFVLFLILQVLNKYNIYYCLQPCQFLDLVAMGNGSQKYTEG